jgi:hypothetical protein
MGRAFVAAATTCALLAVGGAAWHDGTIGWQEDYHLLTEGTDDIDIWPFEYHPGDQTDTGETTIVPTHPADAATVRAAMDKLKTTVPPGSPQCPTPDAAVCLDTTTFMEWGEPPAVVFGVVPNGAAGMANFSKAWDQTDPTACEQVRKPLREFGNVLLHQAGLPEGQSAKVEVIVRFLGYSGCDTVNTAIDFNQVYGQTP